jgi:hypothetical protein
VTIFKANFKINLSRLFPFFKQLVMRQFKSFVSKPFLRCGIKKLFEALLKVDRFRPVRWPNFSSDMLNIKFRCMKLTRSILPGKSKLANTLSTPGSIIRKYARSSGNCPSILLNRFSSKLRSVILLLPGLRYAVQKCDFYCITFKSTSDRVAVNGFNWAAF